MKYFVTTFKRNADMKPSIDVITGFYDLKTMFNYLEELHRNGVLFCVYEAECICDFS